MMLEARQMHARLDQATRAVGDALARAHAVGDRYLDLVREVVLGAVYHEASRGRVGFDEVADAIENGRGWIEPSMTMVGRKRLDDIRQCLESVLADRVPGDFVECGTWRGGACVFARACLEVLDADGGRCVWLADSFRGLPAATHPKDAGFDVNAADNHKLAVDEAVARGNMRALGFSTRFGVIPGWFKDTLPGPVKTISVLRLDGDLYESTMDALRTMYPLLSPGGYCLVDDYGSVPHCRRAIHEYRDEHGITAPLVEVDWTCVRWRKP